jgi:membrane protein DedA with SNARE-associated domain
VTDLPAPLADLAPLLDRYGYPAVVGMVLVESFGVPAPAQTLLILAAVYAGQGRLAVSLVVLCGFAGAVGGDSIGYWIGRLGGRRLVMRVGRYVLLTEDRLTSVEGFFDRHGATIVVVARFIDGLRQFNGVVAGTVGMPWWRFLAYNALGAALWAGAWTTVGYTAGEHLGQLLAVVHRYRWFVLPAAVVAASALVARWWWHRRRERAVASGGPVPPG